MSTWRDIWRFSVIANRLFAENEEKGLKAFRKLHEVYDKDKKTSDGMIHYIYGHALETKGLKDPAIIEYKKAEKLFPVPHWKEVARETYDRVSQNKTPDEYFDKNDFKQYLWCAFNKVHNYTYLNDFARYVCLSALARGSSEWPLSLVDFRTVLELEIKQCFYDEITFYFESEENYSLYNIINSLLFMKKIPNEISQAFHTIRKDGNLAAHKLRGDPKHCSQNLSAFMKSLEFINNYVKNNPDKIKPYPSYPLNQLNLAGFLSKVNEEKTPKLQSHT